MKYTPKQVAARFLSGKGHVTTRMLRKFNIIAAVVLAIQAIALLVLSVAYKVPIYIAHTTGDALQAKLRGTEVTAPALHELWRIDVAYLAAATLLITAVTYVLVATVWRTKYEAWLKKDMQPLRWVAAAVAGSLLLIVLALVVGVNDVANLKSIVMFTVLAILGVAWLELQPSRRGKLDAAGWVRLVIVVGAGVMPWLIILGAMLATNIFGSVGVPSYAWLMLATLVIGCTAYAANVCLARKKQGKWGNYLNAEAWCICLMLVIETVFIWELFAAVLHP
jgi:hypothetical protein